MKFELTREDLFETCTNCKGNGLILNSKTDEYDKNCNVCDGQREEPTDFGWEVIGLVLKWRDKYTPYR